MRRYLDDWQKISAREAQRDEAVDELRHQIESVEARAAEDIGRLRHDQAHIAAEIREHGQIEDDIAELLEITVKQVRQLLALARTHPRDSAVPAEPSTPSTIASEE
ncbi:hypothetical protein ACWEKT_38400 [Nocardia takedensis]